MQFGVPLLYHAKAAKLALNSIEVSVVIGISRNKTTPANEIESFRTVHHMHNVWQSGHPRPPTQFVLDVEVRGRRVADVRLCSQVVAYMHHQVRLVATHEIYVSQRCLGFRRQGRRPY